MTKIGGADYAGFRSAGHIYYIDKYSNRAHNDDKYSNRTNNLSVRINEGLDNRGSTVTGMNKFECVGRRCYCLVTKQLV